MMVFVSYGVGSEQNGIVFDCNRNVGITSTMKTYLSHVNNELLRFNNAGLDAVGGSSIVTDSEGYFNVCILFRLLLGFCGDFKNVIVNTKQELVLIRSSSNLTAAYSSDLNGPHSPFLQEIKSSSIESFGKFLTSHYQTFNN